MLEINEKLLKEIISKKALIWDFDGVLCFMDWYYGEDFDKWWDKLDNLLNEFEPNLHNKKLQDLSYPDEKVDFVLRRHGKKAEEKINDFFLEKESLIIPHSRTNTEIIKIILKLNPDIENYIWSNNQSITIENFLEKNNIRNKIKFITARRIEGYESKPSLHGFKLIQNITDISLADFLFIGDSLKTDKVVAEKLGMDFYLYRHTFQIT